MTDLTATPWANWVRNPIAGDASARQYTRLTDPAGHSVILMETPTEERDSQTAFVSMAEHLSNAGFCPPKVLWQDAASLVLSDLGATDLATSLARNPGATRHLYEATTDLLIALHQTKAPDLTKLTPAVAGDMVRLTATSYCNDPTCAEPLAQAMTDAMERLAPEPNKLALRDFHAENLIWRPNQQGHDRLGLLDFQDAFLAPAGYDLVSLMRDARRDVSQDLYDQMLHRFCIGTDQDAARFDAQMACLGVQRNLRILGVFARLARDLGKTGYVAMLPRVWRHIQADLAHPDLTDLAETILACIPDPTAAQTRWHT